jgi:hypothetical protein
MSEVVRSALRGAYRELIANHQSQAPFWILVGFLPTFVMARIIVKSKPELFLSINGVHVHHFTYGIFVLSTVGFVSIVWPQLRLHRLLAVLYGVGLALLFDEFGMWLHLTANYSLKLSADAMFALLTFLIVAVYFTNVIHSVLKYLPQGWQREATHKLTDKTRGLRITGKAGRK